MTVSDMAGALIREEAMAKEVFLTDDQRVDEARQDQELRLTIVNFVSDYFEPGSTVDLVTKAQTIYDWVAKNSIHNQ
jgi:hypothetical protein